MLGRRLWFGSNKKNGRFPHPFIGGFDNIRFWRTGQPTSTRLDNSRRLRLTFYRQMAHDRHADLSPQPLHPPEPHPPAAASVPQSGPHPWFNVSANSENLTVAS